MTKSRRIFSSLLILSLILNGCATSPPPYTGVNPENSQFERGRPVPPLDFFGDLISKIPQLLFWNSSYGNHDISPETEMAMAEFLEYYGMEDVKIRINQWAPHKEIGRLIANDKIAWPYKILFFPSTLIVSIIARPLSGLIISDYFDPASNTVHIFSDDVSIALHETGHALDYERQRYRGTYLLVRSLPGVNLFQEGIATSEATHYLEETRQYERLVESYKTLYPAYATYAVGYVSASPPAYIGAIVLGHVIGRSTAREKEWQLKTEGKWKAEPEVNLKGDGK